MTDWQFFLSGRPANPQAIAVSDFVSSNDALDTVRRRMEALVNAKRAALGMAPL